uniref:Fatty acid hydroxylase domain-containing protein n=1 Tax=Aplanochytrium stocchinoi TaxID=215587 RepID=A0A7S3LQB6_9STRA
MGVAFHKLHQKIKVGDSSLKTIIKESFLTMILEESHMVYSWFLANYVYAHIPWFDKKRKHQTFGEIFNDYLTCNLPLVIIGAFLEVLVFSKFREEARLKAPPSKHYQPLLFLVKLAWCRAVTDLVFWIGHYLMHKRENYWIHKRHHEHNKTKLTTNYHFDSRDLAIEAFIPFILSVATVQLVNPKLYISRLDQGMLFGYILGLEILSHVGKALPVMSILPPFSPLLTYWDDWNVWFHETHHNLLKCNYSITPYWDCLFGTAKYV